MSNNKLKRVKVDTPKGSRALVFRPVTNIPTGGLICDSECPYCEICDKLPDPRNPKDDNFRFIDFCGDIGMEYSNSNKDEGGDLVPIEGTIENNLLDIFDNYQEILKSNPMVKLSDVIDKLCQNWCDRYNEKHSNCKSDYKLCIIRELFKPDKGDNKMTK